MRSVYSALSATIEDTGQGSLRHVMRAARRLSHTLGCPPDAAALLDAFADACAVELGERPGTKQPIVNPSSTPPAKRTTPTG